ncbi:MAG: tRNA (adenosine(37)-N6)-threonylcarbamoyltransferase complex ATPase subunit type 1 TsaE [Actinobacteria bacterium]|nr:MAG: tRNA (adenosine(37)-N6)-threonylcarbamoyltransferase complex ATPase subunit type 1 TsaE [Actinomycetota bacterium]
MELQLRTGTADDTRAVGAAIAPLLRIHDVMVLTGELGAGKTTLVRGIASGLGASEHVASPTFTLIREYVTGRIPIAHVDVFRLDRVQDVVDLALDEVEDGACVLIVEWGDAVDELLPDDRLRVELTSEDPAAGADARRIAITAEGPSWVERADELVAVTGPWRADP